VNKRYKKYTTADISAIAIIHGSMDCNRPRPEPSTSLKRSDAQSITESRLKPVVVRNVDVAFAIIVSIVWFYTFSTFIGLIDVAYFK